MTESVRKTTTTPRDKLTLEGRGTRLVFGNSLRSVLQHSFLILRRGHKPKPDRIPEVVVSTRYGFAYYGVPLVATRTFLNVFLHRPRLEFAATLHRQPLNQLLAAMPELLSYLKFGIVRNPWSRVVACYERLIRNAYSKDRLLSMRTVKDIGHISMHRGLHPQMCFEAFVDWLCGMEGADDIANRHWMSQHKFLTDDYGTVQCDKLVRLENLDAELRPVFDSLGIDIGTLPILNSTDSMPVVRQHGSYEDYFDAATRAAIGDRYRHDIELFEYDFERMG